MHQFASLLLLGSLLCLSLGEANARRSSYFNEPAAMARSGSDVNVPVGLDQALDEKDIKLNAAGAAAPVGGNKDASSGRLFFRKFFGNRNQPIVPIIITGAGTGVTSPTTPTSPTASGTVTSPTSPTAAGTGTAAASRQYQDGEQADDADGDADAEHEPEQQQEQQQVIASNAELLDEQGLQAALAAGAQEYEVYTNPAEQSSDNGPKANQSNRIQLRRKGGRRGQGNTITVRIPPRYRGYFRNGQKVMLNTSSRPLRRRVVRKRNQNNRNKRINNRRRGGKNKNKRGKNKNRRPRIPMY